MNIICLIKGHKAINFSDGVICSIRCKRCGIILVFDYWKNILNDGKFRKEFKFVGKYFPELLRREWE
jgi:hypothetical protein